MTREETERVLEQIPDAKMDACIEVLD